MRSSNLPNPAPDADFPPDWQCRLVSILTPLFVSAVFHAVLGLFLALIVYRTFQKDDENTLLVTEVVPQTLPQAVDIKLAQLPVDRPLENTASLPMQIEEPELPASIATASPLKIEKQVAEHFESQNDPWPGFSQQLRDSFAGRQAEQRGQLLEQFGGTPESERAVEEGLKWLVRHQRSDGGWSFDHTCPDCDDTCKGPGVPGVHHCTAGATAMALLCFLGAGHTHQTGDYQKEVRAGLRYLLSQRGSTRAGGDYTNGDKQHGMYTQGFAGIALAEAYAMTDDEFLRPVAIAALEFIAAAQDPKRGGWRYFPQQPGDTSVVGWQVMALTSGRIGGLGHWRTQRGRTAKFLDDVQSHRGARYGYTHAERYGNRYSTTAIGLLCRMYLGWNNRKALQEGVQYLSDLGPQPNHMYYNYYATQVLHHWGGDKWIKWNKVMREWLISTQTKYGHGTGSWSTQYCAYANTGGRLYVTCLSILTLEVYYRHLPLYQEKAAWNREPVAATPME